MGKQFWLAILVLAFGFKMSSYGSSIVVKLPPNYDPQKAYPVILYAHGSGQTAETVFTTPLSRAFFRSLRAAGYILVSSNLHGNNWGDEAAIKSFRRMYRFARDRYLLGPIILGGQSMGGPTVLSTLARHGIPNVAAAFLICPVCDIDTIWQDGSGPYAAQIATAYGIDPAGDDYSLKTLGHNPAEIPGADFAGVPLWVCASPDDTVVPFASNSAALIARVSPFTTVQYYPATGDHGDPSLFSPDALADLLDALTSWGVR